MMYLSAPVLEILTFENLKDRPIWQHCYMQKVSRKLGINTAAVYCASAVSCLFTDYCICSNNWKTAFMKNYITKQTRFLKNVIWRTRRPETSDSLVMIRCHSHLRADSEAIFRAAVEAVNPRKLILSNLSVRGNVLRVTDKEYVLKKKCYLVGFGKATYEMAITAESILGEKLQCGIVSIPHGSLNDSKSRHMMHTSEKSNLKFIEGAKNNLPDEDAEAAAKGILELALQLDTDDLLLVLISGGGSALLPLPLNPITLEEKTRVIMLLASAGANIMELNAVRRCLSLIKGGGLAKAAYPAQVVSLILSDIIGDPVDLIASGPTVAPPKDAPLAWHIISKYGLENKIPKSVYDCLHSMKPWSPQIYSHVDNNIVGNNQVAIQAAVKDAHSKNYSTVVLSTAIQGLVPTVALFYTSLACHICRASLTEVGNFIKNSESMIGTTFDSGALISAISETERKKGLCIISGGETTVQVKGNGIGGRNQELALTFSLYIQEALKHTDPLKLYEVLFLSAGTDGIDGPTDAAGAVAYPGQIESWHGPASPKQYLTSNDSNTFYKQLNEGEDLIVTGHTGTNVMDLHILMIT